MRKCHFYLAALALWMASAGVLFAWTPLAVKDDPLVRMPGSQQGQGTLEAANRCMNCHSGYGQPAAEPGSMWQGSMMAQAARDFLYFACVTVAAQDSIHAIGRPNATDICLRCHFPKGWMEDRSDPTNASRMTGADYDGVQCDSCHSMVDPHFETARAGTREGSDWLGYWDETNASATPSSTAAQTTYQRDSAIAGTFALFNGGQFFTVGRLPFSPMYTEAAGGQFFHDFGGAKRASYADATGRHGQLYSRYHKSKYFCASCHDVSNPALANLAYKDTPPGDGVTVLPTESNAAHSYFHVERTFSEFMLSEFGQQGGALGRGPFAPEVHPTSRPGNRIASCQDCHMQDVAGKGCDKADAPWRPGSVEHPKSGVPSHDLTGGNAWVSWVLASTVTGSPNYNATNASLLKQGPAVLTMDLTQGLGINAQALLNGVQRAKDNLQKAAQVEVVSFDSNTGDLRFRIINQTGHKLISGFPEGRRMFVNIQAFKSGDVIHEVNAYDAGVGTLVGLDQDYSPWSPAAGPGQEYVDHLVYEMHPSSSITGEEQTFHFALATGRSKDNRIPPRGFRIQDAAERLAEPVWHGEAAPDYFTAEEYAGGYDEQTVQLPAGCDSARIRLYYQTTSREYIEFLRDQINGTGKLTLPAEAYVAQTDPFFAKLKAWGDTIWQLWTNNKDVEGASPVLMAEATATPSASVSDAKLLADGAAAAVSGLVVTAAFPGFLYVEQDDRANGIRVQQADHGMAVGMRADASGIMGTTSDGERVLVADSVTPSGTGSLQALTMSGRTLGGGGWNYAPPGTAGQRGIAGGAGLNNIGLLVRVAGRVTCVDPGGKFFTIWDGAAVRDAGGCDGVRVWAETVPMPATGQFVLVTGISSCQLAGENLYPLLRARAGSDVVILSEP